MDDTIKAVKEKGAKRIVAVSIVSAPDGVARLQKHHPDVPILTAALDEKLNDKAYIVPGLGDFGDRYFGT
jgi:uracil phosphoribosyltransferase